MENWVIDTLTQGLLILLILGITAAFVIACLAEPWVFYISLALVAFFVLVGVARLAKIWGQRTFGDGPKWNKYPWEKWNDE